ncbi:MAG: GHKL domain-containing protein, partial [Oscillospiraceae bacterium]|nr:GHKL domain-containing protein [Oscillospiraceae bacterium]
LTVSQNITRIICLFITKLLYFAAVQLILWSRKKEKHYFNLNEWIIIISVFLMTLLIGLAMYLIMLNEKISDYVYLASTILLSSLDVIIFIFMKKMNISSQKEREKELLQIQLVQQQNEMRQIEHQYQEICVLRHDFKNSIDCIARMIQQNKREDALHYAEQLKKRKIGNIQTHIECSSSVINAILNSKFSDAHDKGIATSFKMVVQIPESLEFDISIILSNLLDNAIEACCKNDDVSRIVLTITKNNAYYQLLIKNTIDDSVLEWNKSLKTIKAGKNEHGWGLKSIFDIVEKHQGMIEIFEENGEFCVNTLLKEVL